MIHEASQAVHGEVDIGRARWREPDAESEQRADHDSRSSSHDGPFRYPVVALKMSLFPKLAGQSWSGHGAGNTR
jgi:hypothetical protein